MSFIMLFVYYQKLELFSEFYTSFFYFDRSPLPAMRLQLYFADRAGFH